MIIATSSPEFKIITHLLNADAQIVAASFNGYRKAANRVYVPGVHNSIEALLASETAAVAGGLMNLITEVQKAALEKIIDDLLNKLCDLQPGVFEQLIGELVKQGGYHILKEHEYDGEGGDADIVAEADLPPLATVFEQKAILLVQTKLKRDIDHEDVAAVKQLVQIAKRYPGAALVVFSTVNKFTDACITAAEEKGVVLIPGPTLVRLVMKYMSSVQ